MFALTCPSCRVVIVVLSNMNLEGGKRFWMFELSYGKRVKGKTSRASLSRMHPTHSITSRVPWPTGFMLQCNFPRKRLIGHNVEIASMRQYYAFCFALEKGTRKTKKAVRLSVSFPRSFQLRDHAIGVLFSLFNMLGATQAMVAYSRPCNPCFFLRLPICCCAQEATYACLEAVRLQV